MRYVTLILLVLAVCTSISAQPAGTGRKPTTRHGEAAGYSSRNATILSMMGWGLGIGVAIATICALIDNNTGAGGGGNNVHSH